MQTRDRVGASQETIVNCIRSRLIQTDRFDALCEKHGHLKVNQTMYDAAGVYVGTESITSSDKYYMVETFLRFLGEVL